MFSRVSRVVALVAFVLSLFQIAMGFAIASGVIGPYEWALRRYSTASSSGEMIDKGFYVLVASLVIGTLAEIGLAVRKTSLPDKAP